MIQYVNIYYLLILRLSVYRKNSFVQSAMSALPVDNFSKVHSRGERSLSFSVSSGRFDRYGEDLAVLHLFSSCYLFYPR